LVYKSNDSSMIESLFDSVISHQALVRSVHKCEDSVAPI
jgi:hypothetical protein